MARSFGLVDYKVQEAEYFLEAIKESAPRFNFFAAQCNASAFVSAARSITFAMQASLKDCPGFDQWYVERQNSLRNDRLAKFFHRFRTVAQHLGINMVGGGASQGDGVPVYFFTPCPDLSEVPDEDVVTACETYFKMVLGLVYDCYMHFAAIVDGQWYFTEANFLAHGKTIEDAEGELGFPRGWTDIGRQDLEDHRWELLRRQADGCLIQEQFVRWLGKALPRPAKVPPFRG